MNSARLTRREQTGIELEDEEGAEEESGEGEETDEPEDDEEEAGEADGEQAQDEASGEDRALYTPDKEIECTF